MYTPITGTGDGSAPVVTLTFPFLNKSHVKASVDGAEVAYTWSSASQITFSAPVAAGSTWTVYRETPAEALVDFTNGSVLVETDLDTATNQALYRQDEIDWHIDNSTTAADASAAAAKTSETNAAASAAAAATSETNAAASEANAATSETNAAASATQAADVVANKLDVNSFAHHNFDPGTGRLSYFDIGDLGGGKIGLGADDTGSGFPYFSFGAANGSDWAVVGTLTANGRIAFEGSLDYEFTSKPYVGADRIVARSYADALPGVVTGVVSDAQRDANATAINNALASGKKLYLSAGVRIEIGHSLILPNGSGLIGERGGAKPVIYMPASKFNNADDSSGVRYGTNAVGINFSGTSTTAVSDVSLRNFVLESESLVGRVVRGIVGRNVTDSFISDVELKNFPTGNGITLASAQRITIHRPYIHDFYDNTGWSFHGQITAIEIDNDLLTASASSSILIVEPHIENMVMEGTWAKESDGINIAHQGAQVQITRPYIRNVGEGMDIFGAGCTISDPFIADASIFGIKFIHGAQRNVVTNAVIDNPGLAGLVFAGSDVAGADTADNLVVGLTINGGTWSYGGDTAGVLVEDNTGTAGKPRRNRVINATINITTGAYGWLDTSTGSGNRGVEIGINGTPAQRRVYSQNGGSIVKTSETAYAKLTTAAQAIPTSVDTPITWAAEADDGMDMHSLTANTDVVTVPYSGWYELQTHVQYDVNSTGTRIIRFSVNGVNRIIRAQVPAVNGRETTVDLRERVLLTAGDAIRVVAFQDSGSSVNVNGGNSWFSVELVREA